MNRRFSPPWRFIRLMACAVLTLLVAGSAFAQFQTGNVFGTVVDNQTQPLPGVTVTLTGVGAPQTFVTDSAGNFRFLSLSPGRYSLKAELQGFGTVTRSNVDVNIGRNTNIDISLTPALEQTITVTAETPLLDTRKTGTGTTVTRVELEEVPTARDPWVVLQQVPGVLMDRINVGGNESGQQSQFVSKGSEGDQATFNVDGVNITDMAATGSSPAYYDFDAFEEIQVTTGGTDPRVQTPGAQLNMVTKRGTNDFRGSGRYYLTDAEWQADPEIPAEATPYLLKVNEIDQNRDMGLELGGPILRDRLWLWGAFSDQQIDLFVAQPNTPSSIAAGRFSDKTTLETLNFKLNAQILSNNSLAGIWTDAGKVKIGRNASPSRPPDTTWNQDNFGPEGIWKIEDTHIFSPNLYLTGMYSKVNGGFELIANSTGNCKDMDCALTSAPDPARLDLRDGTWRNSFLSIEILRPQKQWRFDGSTFFDTAAINHELKFGFGYRDTPFKSLYAWPFGYYMVDYQGLFGLPPGFGGVYIHRSVDAWTTQKYTDVYLGDTMLLGNWTIQAGLRYDLQKGSMENTTAPAHPLFPEVFPAASFNGESAGEMEWKSISPRLGVTYSLGSTRRTLFRGAYNRYADQLGAGQVAFNPLNYQYAYFYYDDVNANNRVERDEILFDYGVIGCYNCDINDPSRVTLFTRYDSDVDPTTTDEIILGVEHELMPEFTVGINLTHREITDFTWARPEKTQGRGDWYTSADYVQGGVVTGFLPPCNPSNTQPCTGQAYSAPYYVLREGVQPASFFVLTNRPDYSQTYDGVELNLIKRLSNRWMLRGSFSWNDWEQEVGPNGFIDPTQSLTGYGCSNCDGSDVVQGSGSGSGAKGGIYINSRWAANVTGLYQIPVIDVNFGFNLFAREGYPIPYFHARSTSEGTKNVLVNGVTGARHEDPINLDLRLSKDIRMGPVGLTLSVDAFNITNEQTVLQRNIQLARNTGRRNTANRISETQSPRVFRVGARLTF